MGCGRCLCPSEGEGFLSWANRCDALTQSLLYWTGALAVLVYTTFNVFNSQNYLSEAVGFSRVQRLRTSHRAPAVSSLSWYVRFLMHCRLPWTVRPLCSQLCLCSRLWCAKHGRRDVWKNRTWFVYGGVQIPTNALASYSYTKVHRGLRVLVEQQKGFTVKNTSAS